MPTFTFPYQQDLKQSKFYSRILKEELDTLPTRFLKNSSGPISSTAPLFGISTFKRTLIGCKKGQGRSARFITGDYISRDEGCVSQMLAKLNLPVLQERRKANRLIFKQTVPSLFSLICLLLLKDPSFISIFHRHGGTAVS